MKISATLKSSLLLLGLLILADTLVAQEVKIRPNDATSQHVMIEPLNTNFGVFLGEAAGRLNVGINNTFLGGNAGYSNTEGDQNTFVGTAAGQANQNADFNTIVGSFAGAANTTGGENTFLGQAAGNVNTTGSFNTFLGRNTGANNTTGSWNTFLGRNAGYLNNGSGNVFLGSDAGFNETGGNKLIIHNNSSAEPLIYGEFDNKLLRTNADLVNIKSVGDVKLLIEADTDNVNEDDNPLIEFSQDGGAVKTFLGYDQNTFGPNIFGIGSAQKDKILLVDEFGNVGINAMYFSVGLNVQSVPNDTYILNAEDENGIDRLQVRSDGHVGINATYPNCGLNVRSVANDVYALNVQDENGTNRLMVSPGGHVGINAFASNVGLNVRSIAGDVYALNVQDDTGTNRLSVSPDGQVGIDGDLVNIKSVGDVKLLIEADTDNVNEDDNPLIEFSQDGGIVKTFLGYDQDNFGGNIFGIGSAQKDKILLVEEYGHVGINATYGSVGLNVQSVPNDAYIFNAEDENGTNRLSVTPDGRVVINATNENTFIGQAAGNSNTTGSLNTFLGKNAGASNTTAGGNTFLGQAAGNGNTTGSSNTFLGRNAGASNTTAGGNTFVGVSAGDNNTTGSNNTYMGIVAGTNNVDGINNTLIGADAGFNNIHGSGNVFLGSEAGYNETGSNKLIIHNNDSAEPLIYGDFDNKRLTINGNLGINVFYSDVGLNVRSVENDIIILNLEDETGANKFTVYPSGNATLAGTLTQNSDRRLKKNIAPLKEASNRIQQLGGYSYNWIAENSDDKTQIGVIAQEVQAVYPELVKEDEAGILSVNYSGLSAVLIEAVKEQQAEIDQQQSQLDGQARKIEALMAQLQNQAATLDSVIADLANLKTISDSNLAADAEKKR